MPPPLPPSVNEGRRTSGNPIFAAEFKSVFKVVDQRRPRHVETNLGHCIFEKQPVFGLLDRPSCAPISITPYLSSTPLSARSTARFNAVCPPTVGSKANLPCSALTLHHRRFNANDLFQVLWGERLDVRPIRHLRIGHDGRGIRIREHNFIAFGFQRLACLRAGIIEFCRLPDHDRTRADDQDFRDVVTTRHLALPFL